MYLANDNAAKNGGTAGAPTDKDKLRKLANDYVDKFSDNWAHHNDHRLPTASVSKAGDISGADLAVPWHVAHGLDKNDYVMMLYAPDYDMGGGRDAARSWIYTNGLETIKTNTGDGLGGLVESWVTL